jgi:hypothetical protein
MHARHAYIHPVEETARAAGTGRVDPSCTVAGAQLCRGDNGEYIDAMLNQTDLAKNANKFYACQLVSNGNTLYAFTRLKKYYLSIYICIVDMLRR